jgi:hypothetical protein
LPSGRLNVRYKPGHISKRGLLEYAIKDGIFVLTGVAKNISGFGVMTPCIVVDGTGVSQEITVPSSTPLQNAAVIRLEWIILSLYN